MRYTFSVLLCAPHLIMGGSDYFENIAKCEHNALELGTRIADIFNAPNNGEGWDKRLNQDYITQNLGFAPWIVNGLHGSGGVTTSGKNAMELQKIGGWLGKPIVDSPYNILDRKWVYMLGDSTTRQIWASYAAPFQSNNFERNAKEWTRHYCKKQSHRTQHVKGGNFPEEGWRGPCGANEVTCHVSGYGDGGLLTFDWKHFPVEDYDNYLWGDDGAWLSGFEGEGNRRPDILTIQTGLHTCWHTHPQGLYSSELTAVNQTMLKQHIDDLRVLMRSVRRAIDLSNQHTDGNSTRTVIVVTSGASYAKNGWEIDDCILRLNRAAETEAHKQGFAVLERGEIERRLMFKSLHPAMGEKPPLAPDMHLSQPAQNIVSTCLLSLMTCLQPFHMGKLAKDFIQVNLELRAAEKSIDPKPLHSPPG